MSAEGPIGDGTASRAGEMTKPPTEVALIRRIIRSALGAMDQKIADLSLFGMHKDGAAFAARVVDRVRAGDQDRWGAYDMAVPGCRN
jgi:hypothetical protein